MASFECKIVDNDNNMTAGFDPHSYTSGRWLRNDKHERQMRQIDHNFNELCRKVVELSSGAQSIKSCEKREGGFNRVFIFTMDDGSRLVARLPFSTLAGPAKLATASEVATIRYCACTYDLGNSSAFANAYAPQCKEILVFLSLEFLTGATTPRTVLEASTLSWNMQPVFSYSRNGPSCREIRK